jgi:hypothetical protein
LSESKNAKIEALPDACLPSNKKRRLKIDEDEDGQETKRPQGKEKKRESSGGTAEVSEGLKAAVEEVLKGYKPRSAERLPFYCRACQKQYANSEEFFAHKETDFHLAAVSMERKASYCKLCKKQLTSPTQLKEHLSSRPHKERLHYVQSKQQQGFRHPNQGKRKWT